MSEAAETMNPPGGTPIGKTLAGFAFPALGKPFKGVCVSLSRLLLFLTPLFLLPEFMGISGVAYTGLAADGITFLFAAAYGLLNLRRCLQGG